MIFKISTSFLWKMISYNHGATTILSGGFGAWFVLLLEKLSSPSDDQNLYLIGTTEIIGFLLYMSFLFVDFKTGVRAAEFLNSISPNPSKDWKKSHKLYRTFWKLLGVSLISVVITFLALFAEVIESNLIWILMWFLVWFWVLACSFEFHSIGENIKKFSGNKPEIFEFWDKITFVIEKKLIQKVEDSTDESNK